MTVTPTPFLPLIAEMESGFRIKTIYRLIHLKIYWILFTPVSNRNIPSLHDLGFKAKGQLFPSAAVRTELIKKYTEQRNFPSLPGTSRLGVHLRFGTISIRELAKKAMGLNETFLNELIWRDFYHMILWHFPQVGEGKAFKPVYDLIQWRNNESEFEKWCNGQTGYPIVDAGMRELNETGFMHNRVQDDHRQFSNKAFVDRLAMG